MGKRAADILPEYIFDFESENFVCSACIKGESAGVNVTVVGETTVLRITPENFKEHFQKVLATPAVINSLRSSLGNLKISVSLLMNNMFPDGVEAGPQMSLYSSVFYHNYYSLLRTVTNMDAMTRIINQDVTLNRELFELNSFCSDIVKAVLLVTGECGVEISFVPEENIVVWADKDKIERMLLNVLGNALAHTPEGGKITLGVKRTKKHVMFMIDDNGDGISAEIMSNIFSRFDRESSAAESAQGCGFGMFIARGIAEKHGGSLMIASREGEGTSVRIIIADEQPDGMSVHDSRSSGFENGMDIILRELSDVIDAKYYNHNYI